MDEKKPKPNSDFDLAVAVILGLAILVIFGAFLGGVFSRYEEVIEWFRSAAWQRLNLTLALISMPFNIFFLCIIVVIFRRYQRLIAKKIVAESAIAHAPPPKDEIANNWTQIREFANSTNPSDWNMAVLRADALLEDVLTHLGYEGTTLAERLKIVDSTKLPSIERVWSAHRLRNMIAHDPMEQHMKETIVHALRSYEQALKELGVFKEE